MNAFWAKGYEATSLHDLMTATGLHKGSLYKAFGDKHSLFVLALKRYLHAMRQASSESLKSAGSPLDALRAVAHGMVEFVDDSPCPMGCMAVNALVEMAPHDPEVKEIMADHLARMRQTIGAVVGQAQAAGQLSSERPPELVTAMILTLLAGIGTTIKGAITKVDGHRLVDAQIDALR